MIDDAGGRFAIDPDTGVVTVDNGSLLDGPATHTITVEAGNGTGEVSSADFEIDVTNVAPEITALNSTNADLQHKSQDGEAAISGSYFDPALALDTHTVTVDWGDGSDVEALADVDQANDDFTGAHAYEAGGVYTITVTVTDSDGGVAAAAATTAVVQGVGLVDGVLYVIGTDGDDKVKAQLVGGSDGGADAQVKVVANFDMQGSDGESEKHFFDPADVDRIEMHLCDGDDQAKLGGGSDDESDGGLDIPSQIDGGAGDDHLVGGAASDILLGGDGDDMLKGGEGHDALSGGAGDDKLKGGDGRDLLIGGDGEDTLKGGDGDDLLIGGLTANENDAAALDAALASWNSGDLNDALFHLGAITDDNNKDKLDGENGDDALFGGDGDKLKS